MRPMAQFFDMSRRPSIGELPEIATGDERRERSVQRLQIGVAGVLFMVLLVGLALALSDLRIAGWRRTSTGLLVASVLLFAFFYEILAAEPLAGPMSFQTWTWLPSWK